MQNYDYAGFYSRHSEPIFTQFKKEADRFTNETLLALKFNPDDRYYQLLSLAGVRLAPLLYVTKGSLERKTILDLACGAYPSNVLNKTLPEDRFEPWFCRLLFHLDKTFNFHMRVIGVDLGNLEEELFEHHSYVNLTDSQALNFLDDHSIDVVHASTYLWAPNYAKCYSGLPQALRKHAQRLTKKEGVYLQSYSE